MCNMLPNSESALNVCLVIEMFDSTRYPAVPLIDKETRSGKDVEKNPNNLITQLKDSRNEEQYLLTVSGSPL